MIKNYLGPFRIDIENQDENQFREIGCKKYSKCLEIVSNGDWAGFTCKGCRYMTPDAYEVTNPIEERDLARRIPIDVFLERIDKVIELGKYTPDNFFIKIYNKVSSYYGKNSKELLYVYIQLAIIKKVLDDDNTEMEELTEQSDRLMIELHNPPDLYQIYLKVCGSQWV